MLGATKGLIKLGATKGLMKLRATKGLNFNFYLFLFSFRFFFKRYCEDLGMEIMEEYSDDIVMLPLTQGKIIGRVEKAT